MSTDNDTVPAAETDNAEPKSPSIAELIETRHQALPDHERHLEIGETHQTPAPAPEPVKEAAPAADSAQPAPKAETPPDPAAKPEKEQPFWYRKEIEKERKARQAAERELEQARRQPAPQPQRQATEEDDPDRPLTRREVDAIRAQDALIGRLERSEDRFVDKHGEETFEKTRDWLATRPDIEEWALKQRDSWGAAFSQYRKEELAAEIGEDPAAWREKERLRIREELLAEQADRDQHQPAQRTAPQMRSPPPPPASTARSAAPRDEQGRFAGPADIRSLTKNKFG